MKGLARTLFEEREGITSTPSYFEQLIEKGFFSEVDQFFAECMLNDKGSSEQQLFLAALLWSSRQGHLCMPLGEKEFFAAFGEESEKVTAQVQRGARESSSMKGVCIFEQFAYLKKNWFFETRFLECLENLLSAPAKTLSAVDNQALTSEQQEAVGKALSQPLTLLAGGPGTGKTYTAAHIVQAFCKQFPKARVVLAAPTGKAAKQLEQKLQNISVSTLHALLGVHKESDYSSDAPYIMADLLIVDECSMVDARLFSYLLYAIRPGTHLVLMGDPYQLPPVETGSLFADLIEVLETKSPHSVTRLTKWLRSDRQEILQAAEAIKSGEVDTLMKLLSANTNHALKYIELGDVSTLHEQIWSIASAFFPTASSQPVDAERLWQAKESFGLLSCLRKGPFGVDTLNEMFAKRFLSQMRPGDTLAQPILITRSSADLDLRNGETGILIRHASGQGDFALFGPAPFKRLFSNLDLRPLGSFRDLFPPPPQPCHHSDIVFVGGEKISSKSSSNLKELGLRTVSKQVPSSLLPPYEYAYCLSVHKSQGSEYEQVCLVAPPGAEYFGREIIYTGATRSKKSLTIVSTQEILEQALMRASRKISALHARLQICEK